MTPADEAAALLAKITPGEWLAVWIDTPNQQYCQDIIATDGKHVVCFGHDYDDYGFIDNNADAEFIAAAPRLVRALLDEQTRQTQILTRLNRRCQVAEAAAHPNATSGKGQKVSAYLWEMNTRLFGLCESHSPERLEQPGGYTRPSCVVCDAEAAEEEITRLREALTEKENTNTTMCSQR